MLANHIGEGAKPGDRGRLARFDAVDFAPETVQPGEPDCRRHIAFVGKVVGFAGEAVDERNGMPEAGGQQQRSDREIFVVIYRHRGEKNLIGFKRLQRELHGGCKLRTLTVKCGVYYNQWLAKVAELVDAPDLGSGAERRVGSSPSFRTR